MVVLTYYVKHHVGGISLCSSALLFNVAYFIYYL